MFMVISIIRWALRRTVMKPMCVKGRPTGRPMMDVVS